MFKCEHCERTFEEPTVKIYTEYEEFWGAMVPYKYEEAYCPTCGDENFEEYEEIEEEI